MLAGGRARPDLGPYFFEPTLLAGVTDEHGPVPRRDLRPRRGRVPLLVGGRDGGSAPTTASTGSTRASGRATSGRARDRRAPPAGTVNVNEAYAATGRPPRRWAASSSRAWSGVTGGTASSSSPRRRRWPCSACSPSTRRRFLSHEQYAAADDAPCACSSTSQASSDEEALRDGPDTSKHVLITGRASGIGRLLVPDALALGAPVTVWDVDETCPRGPPRSSSRDRGLACARVYGRRERPRACRRVARTRCGTSAGAVDVTGRRPRRRSGRPLLELPGEESSTPSPSTCWRSSG